VISVRHKSLARSWSARNGKRRQVKRKEQVNARSTDATI
jgi:hypothetical protein